MIEHPLYQEVLNHILTNNLDETYIDWLNRNNLDSFASYDSSLTDQFIANMKECLVFGLKEKTNEKYKDDIIAQLIGGSRVWFQDTFPGYDVEILGTLDKPAIVFHLFGKAEEDL